jgi:hypothetical protein
MLVSVTVTPLNTLALGVLEYGRSEAYYWPWSPEVIGWRAQHIHKREAAPTWEGGFSFCLLGLMWYMDPRVKPRTIHSSSRSNASEGEGVRASHDAWPSLAQVPLCFSVHGVRRGAQAPANQRNHTL